MVIAQSVGTWVEKKRVDGLSPRADETWNVSWQKVPEHCRTTLDPLVPHDPERNKGSEDLFAII